MLFEKIRLFFVHLLQRGQAMPIGKKEDVGGGLGGDLRSELVGAEFHLDGEDCRLNILLSNPFPCLIWCTNGWDAISKLSVPPAFKEVS